MFSKVILEGSGRFCFGRSCRRRPEWALNSSIPTPRPLTPTSRQRQGELPPRSREFLSRKEKVAKEAGKHEEDEAAVRDDKQLRVKGIAHECQQQQQQQHRSLITRRHHHGCYLLPAAFPCLAHQRQLPLLLCRL